MFGKVIVFGLFEMIKKKKMKSEDRVLGSGFGLRVGSSHLLRLVPVHVSMEFEMLSHHPY